MIMSIRTRTALIVAAILLLAGGVSAPAFAAGEPGRGAQKPQNPCSLISRAQLTRAAHARVLKLTDAPLGPTCIVRFKGWKQDLTIALQTSNVKQQVKLLEKRKSYKIAKHKAYCGKLGGVTFIVQLNANRSLVIDGPCATAERIALKAVPHVKSVA